MERAGIALMDRTQVIVMAGELRYAIEDAGLDDLLEVFGDDAVGVVARVLGWASDGQDHGEHHDLARFIDAHAQQLRDAARDATGTFHFPRDLFEPPASSEPHDTDDQTPRAIRRLEQLTLTPSPVQQAKPKPAEEPPPIVPAPPPPERKGGAAWPAGALVAVAVCAVVCGATVLAARNTPDFAANRLPVTPSALERPRAGPVAAPPEPVAAAEPQATGVVDVEEAAEVPAAPERFAPPEPPAPLVTHVPATPPPAPAPAPAQAHPERLRGTVVEAPTGDAVATVEPAAPDAAAEREAPAVAAPEPTPEPPPEPEPRLAAPPDVLAVLANPVGASGEVSSTVLKRMLRGDSAKWPGGQGVVVVLPPAGSAEMAWLCDEVVGMPETAYLRHLGRQAFRGEIREPIRADSVAEAARIIRTTPGAVGALPMSHGAGLSEIRTR